MKKLFVSVLSVILMTLLSVSAIAQERSGNDFDLGSNRFGIGVGLANVSGGSIVVPPVHFSYERGLFCVGKSIIGLGGVVEYGSSRVNKESSSDAGLAIQALGKWHFFIGQKCELNPYVGIGYGTYGNEVARINNFASTAGVEFLFHFSPKTAIFIGAQACSVPNISALRLGLYF